MDKTAARVVIVCGVVAAFALILIHYVQREGSLVLSCSQWPNPPPCQQHQLETLLYAVIVVSAGIAAWVVNARRA